MTTPLALQLSLAGRRVVVVGGGPVAARKVRSVRAADAQITVVAPWVCEEIRDLAASGDLVWITRDYQAGDLHGAWLVFAATGDRDTDEAVEAAATADRTFCVRVDDAATGTARSTATVVRDGLQIGIGATAGADPRRAAHLRDALAQALDRGDLPLHRHRPGPGRVVLVGGGPGDPDLLTVRARRELAAAEVVVHDRLGPVGVLAELRPEVLLIDVGKTPGRHPVPQPEINRLLVEHAQAGRRVVRLKGGDPFLFGRGGEEVLACREAGVDVTVVPGVTSAISVPAAAGIPVTHRGLSRQVTVLSGHDAVATDRRAGTDWARLVDPDATLVVLMGMALLPEVTAGLLAAGLAPDTPAAAVANGWTPQQQTVVGTVDTLAADVAAAGLASPAVVVIGAVAALATG